VGGTPEIVNDPWLGSTVPAGDPTQLADSLILALKMDKNGLFKKCAESAKRFSLDRYIDEHEQLYKGLTKK
jgi:glycosyltransferase involved in cell wall biosynthesis